MKVGIYGGTLASTSNDSITNQTNKENWTGYSGGKLVVKRGQQVWNYITRNRAQTEAEKLYNKTQNNVKSKLISSYGWDTALKFMQRQENNTVKNYPIDSVGGYYGQTSISTTGYDLTHPCNIYDMGGNVWEWTTEWVNGTYTNCARRGGYYNRRTDQNPAAYRSSNWDTITAIEIIGFRIALYM